LAFGATTSVLACGRFRFLHGLFLFELFIGGQVYWVFPHLTTPCHLYANGPSYSRTNGS
jgi:hypothetical protein